MQIRLSVDGTDIGHGNTISIPRGTSETLVPRLVSVGANGEETSLQNVTFDWEIKEANTSSTVTDGMIDIGIGETNRTLTLVVTAPSHNLSREITIDIPLGLPAVGELNENQANRNHYSDTFVPWPDTTEDRESGPDIRVRVNDWFDNNANVSPVLRHSTVHARLPNLNIRQLLMHGIIEMQI